MPWHRPHLPHLDAPAPTGHVLRKGLVVLVVAALVATTCPPAANPQTRTARRGWWAGLDAGWGTLRKTADATPTNERSTLAMGFYGGMTARPWLRLGVVAQGWVLQAGNLDDPARGENVSEVGLEARVYPLPAREVFIRTGAARSYFATNHPDDWGSRGWGGWVGAGTDVRISRRFKLTPSLAYHGGSLGSVRNPVVTSTGRRYRVVDLTLGLTYH